MIKVSLYNEKSKVGKSILSVQLANIIKKKFNKSVSIVDCSDDQVLYEKRELEKKKFLRPSSQNDFENLAKIYSENEIESINEDIVFFDLDAVNEKSIELLINCDYLFIVNDSFYDNENEKEFLLDLELLDTFKKIRMDQIPLKEIFIIVNKYKGKTPDLIIDDVMNPFIKLTNDLKSIITIKTSNTKNLVTLSDNIYRLIYNLSSVLVND